MEHRRMGVREIPAAPPANLRFRRRVRLTTTLKDLWRSRELVRALAERLLRARYKQAVLGFAWALIPPVVLMVVLSVFVQRVVDIPTRGVPYPLFSYVALVPWTFFATSVTAASGSILTSMELINKIYAPREVFPLASIVTSGVDALVGLLALGILFLVYAFAPAHTSFWVPALAIVQLAFTVGICLTLSALVVYLRDLRHAVPVIVQLGLFATPIAYGMDQIPRSLRLPYSALNPLAPVIDGYRRTVLLGEPPQFELLLAGAVTSFALLVVGFVVFKRLEAGFADVT
jgi:ABC-2 type transport system permease protein/lipopolysaccharide transport system permease protein